LGTLRKDQNNITRQGLDWNPHRKRRKGGPRVTCKRTVFAELQEQNVSLKEVKQMLKNRVRWRKFVMALCSTGNEDEPAAFVHYLASTATGATLNIPRTRITLSPCSTLIHSFLLRIGCKLSHVLHKKSTGSLPKNINAGHCTDPVYGRAVIGNR
jgi:hypothetical protein